MSDLGLISMINNFPIGDNATSREELLSKAEIVSFLSRFQEQFSAIENTEERENVVRQYLGEILDLSENETIPNLKLAEEILKLSPGFVQDFGKIQLISETNPAFEQTFDVIADNLDLVNTHSKSRR